MGSEDLISLLSTRTDSYGTFAEEIERLDPRYEFILRAHRKADESGGFNPIPSLMSLTEYVKVKLVKVYGPITSIKKLVEKQSNSTLYSTAVETEDQGGVSPPETSGEHSEGSGIDDPETFLSTLAATKRGKPHVRRGLQTRSFYFPLGLI